MMRCLTLAAVGAVAVAQPTGTFSGGNYACTSLLSDGSSDMGSDAHDCTLACDAAGFPDDPKYPSTSGALGTTQLRQMPNIHVAARRCVRACVRESPFLFAARAPARAPAPSSRAFHAARATQAFYYGSFN